MATMDVWRYRETTWTQADLSGFGVEAIDGSIGKVDEASNDVGASFIVVDTGPWIFGKKVMLPAGVVRDVDLDAQTGPVRDAWVAACRRPPRRLSRD
jgi:hypothetical protein